MTPLFSAALRSYIRSPRSLLDLFPHVFDFLNLSNNILSANCWPTERPAAFNMDAAMNDTHKRTSISQLLNPLGAVSSMPSPPRVPTASSLVPSAPLQNGQGIQQDASSLHAPGSSFQLRSASWEQGGDDQSPSRRTDGPDPSRPFPYSPFSEGYGADARAIRSRDGPSNFTVPNGPWPVAHEVSNIPYGSSIITPMYSDERTGECCLFCDYREKANRTLPYQHCLVILVQAQTVRIHRLFYCYIAHRPG